VRVPDDAVTPRDLPSMPELPSWLPGWPRMRGAIGLAPTDALAVCSICSRVSLARGEVLYRRDDPSDAMYLVQSGHVLVAAAVASSDAAIVAVMGRGMPIGNLALTRAARGGPPRRASTPPS
jgi:CRP/FNR family transcriptional regulator, cyclic AMP receptor protein